MTRRVLDSPVLSCSAVSQVCSEDGMEFTLRTPEGFVGRIYAHGFYDRCFFRGNGGTVNVLRISGAQGYPDCGTQRVGGGGTARRRAASGRLGRLQRRGASNG